jgi:hypothetical protein
LELSVYKSVTINVTLQLLLPERPIGLGNLRVQRTSVPEASINENHDSLSPEDKVWPYDQVIPALTLGDPRPKAQLDSNMAPPSLDASTPEGVGQSQLSALVALAPNSGHDIGALLGVKNIWHQGPRELRFRLRQMRRGG